MVIDELETEYFVQNFKCLQSIDLNKVEQLLHRLKWEIK